MVTKDYPAHSLVNEILERTCAPGSDQMNRVIRHVYKGIYQCHEDPLRPAAVKTGNEEGERREEIGVCVFGSHWKP